MGAPVNQTDFLADHDRIERAMAAEGVFQLRRYPMGGVSVVMMDDRTGSGRTFREAIDNASHERLAG
ncbi:hypothetical protein [Qipengyuania atrilutea]|uniref:Uncharacterized protein n=1 Tax=Qipengyuania atrilutea TaxID=2744473 RepID=A0A850GXN5_9SPHN|nr:hypothetical protein [Actirhodobacter atriluteus]NVD44354.1 hypothetical protein [Actirhodobacter atriluteus]